MRTARSCPRCGESKTESVRHGVIYNTLWRMGYHLRRCSRCNRLRLFKRTSRTRQHPYEMTREELQVEFNRKIAKASRRTFAAPETPVTQVSPIPEQAESEAKYQTKGTSAVFEEAPTGAASGRYCPYCGSWVFRRSKRRFLERLFGRPRMARCMDCYRRFPYPR